MANVQRRDNRPAEQVRKQLEDLMRQGTNVADSLKIVGRSRSWYETQRRTDRDWAELIDKIRATVADPNKREQDAGEFEEFAAKYLNRKIWPHQLNMIDVLEGREPRFLHPAMHYEPGSQGNRRVLINVPPNHAKSQTVTIDYATYKVISDPDMSILVISKTQEMAKKMLYGIKQRLTHPRYADLQLAFAPMDGWKSSADQWSATKIYLDPASRTGTEKDATVEAVGMGGQIYGNRASLIIVDDAVVLSNASAWNEQMEWLRQEAASRLGPGGQLLVIGTRVASVDLYSELRNPENYTDGRVPYTVLRMPAVLEYSENEADWQTLWPVSDEPFEDDDIQDENGNYPRWNGPRLAVVRNEVGPRKWSLVYQNMDIEEDSTFDQTAVRACINGKRHAGPLNPKLSGHPDNVDGFYTVCSMDPAMKGNTAACAYTVDRSNGMRYLLDMRVLKAPTPQQIRECIEDMTTIYRPHDWIIEENAFQGFLVHDEQIQKFLANRGITVRPHQTGNNKKDPDFGVASMSTLFGTVAQNKDGLRHGQGDNLISLPSGTNFGVKLLVEELTAWSPAIKTKNRRQDTVMALWFAELRIREVMTGSKKAQYFGKANTFVSERDKKRQMVVNLDDFLAQRQDTNQWV